MCQFSQFVWHVDARQVHYTACVCFVCVANIAHTLPQQPIDFRSISFAAGRRAADDRRWKIPTLPYFTSEKRARARNGINSKVVAFWRVCACV